ncbi:MAG: ABC transporter ATP-binding protein [Pseudomonadota bacterium]|nr:ABC transporter ATP-binding protein [Pseudomonadota bacterium]
MIFYRQLTKLVGAKNRRTLVLLQLLFLSAAVLQVASVAAIPPFITMLNENSVIQSNALLSWAYQVLGFNSDTNFIIAYAVGATGLILLANGVSGFSTWRLLKTSMNLGAYIQRKIFNNYLQNDYSFFALNNSNRLISQITQEIPRMIYMVVQPILNLISQFFIAALIIVGLFVVNFKIALVAVFLVSAIYFLIFKIIRQRVVDNGYKITELNKKKLKVLNESIAGIKEVKLRGNEERYMEELDNITLGGLNASAFVMLAGDLPRFIVETIIFSAILGLSIYILLTMGSTSNALSIVSLYAMAGYKLLPAAQIIYKSYSQIKANGMVVFDLVRENEISEHYKNSVEALGDKSVNVANIKFDKVCYRYPESERLAIKDCSFEIKRFEVTAFVGSSGAGKSTCVDLLLGLLTPSGGTISVAGVPIDRSNLRNWRSKIGYVAQDIFLLDGSFRDNIAFGEPPESIDERRLVNAAKMANIHDFIMGCEGEYDFAVGERGAKLSGGQRQRIGIARALYRDPEVIIFDEATSALDNITEHNILRDIQKLAETKTIIMIAHRLTTVENADKIILFENGTVIDQGRYSELAQNSESFINLLKAGSSTFQ